jgi:hypothetical protein
MLASGDRNRHTAKIGTNYPTIQGPLGGLFPINAHYRPIVMPARPELEIFTARAQIGPVIPKITGQSV